MAGRIAYYGNISTQGLVLNLDAAIQGSYPKTGSTWFDISNNGNNGTLTNGPLYTGSDYGAIVFDGTNDYVDCGTASIIPNSWTLTSWIKHSYRVGYSNIIARSANAPLFEQNATLGWATIRSSSFSVGGRLTNGTFYYECTSSVFLNTGSILNIVGTFNEPTTTLTLYINGTPVNTKNTGFPMTITGSQRIQVGCSDGNTPANFFSGSIYQTQIYNQALSQFQVWQNFNAYKSRYGIPDIVTDGLVLNLDAGNPYSYLSGSSGTTWTNTSGIGNNGTLVNGASYADGYIRCDGTNDYIEVLDNSSLDFSSGSFTVEYWFRKLQTTTGYDNIWGPNKWNVGSSPGTNEWVLLIGQGDTGTGNQYGFQIETNTGGYSTGFSSTELSLNTWYQLIAQRDGANLKTYLNGTLTMNVTASGFTTSSIINNISGRNLRINNSSVNQLYTNADNAILRIYNKALTPTEITQNFNALRGRYGI